MKRILQKMAEKGEITPMGKAGGQVYKKNIKEQP